MSRGVFSHFNDGRPRVRPTAERFEEKYIPEPNSGCFLWLSYVGTNGYASFHVNKVGDRRANRVAWELYRGPIPDGMHVLHKCDNRVCVNPDHLFLGTHLDNMRDMKAKGRLIVAPITKGEASPLHKLTLLQAKEIKYSSVSYTKLAAKFCVSVAAVQKIKHNKMWKDI